MKLVGWRIQTAIVGLCVGFPLASAIAQEPPKVAVAPVVVEGETGPGLGKRATKRISTALEAGGYTVVGADPPNGQCTDDACVMQLARDVGATLVVVAGVGTVDNDYKIVVNVYDANASIRSSRDTLCEICSMDEALDSLVEEVRGLQPEVAQLIADPHHGSEPARPERIGPAVLVVRTEPKGAQVSIDGKSVGVTPLQVKVKAGPHEVRIAKPGHVPEETWIRARSGTEEVVDVQLAKSADTQNRALKIVAGTLSGVGIAALAGGATMLAFHHSPVKSRCSGDNIDIMGRCRYRYDLRAGGIALTTIGIGALITGITSGLIVHGRKRNAKRRRDDFEEDSLSLRPEIGPDHVGLSGRF